VGNIIVRILSIVGPAALAAATLINAPAQAATTSPSADASGKALLLVPLTLVKVDDLDFGSIVASGVSGVVTLNAATGVRSFAGGVTGVPSDAGKPASFAGAGTPNQQVIITVNAPAELVSPTNDKIPVLALTLDGPAVRTIDPATRAFFVNIGGSLSIGVDQPDGVYSANFDVTAYYQ
jgi:hypothetical protein